MKTGSVMIRAGVELEAGLEPTSAARGRRRRHPEFGAAVSLLTLLLAVASGCSELSSSTPGAGAELSPAPLAREGIVRSGPLEDVFLLSGELKAVRSLELVTPRSEGWQVQIKWLAEDGATVGEGEKVIEFDSTAVAQSLEESKLWLIRAEIALESREAAIEAEQEEKRFALERAANLAEKARVEAAVPADLRPRREWQEKQAALARASADLEKARLELEAAEVSSAADLEVLRIARDKAVRDIEATRRSLDSLTIRAPRDGIFVVNDYWREDRKFQVGDTTWPGQSVAAIPDLTEMEVVGRLAEVDHGRIEPGMDSRCIMDTYPERTIAGKIESVGAVAEEAGYRTRGGGGFRVRVSLEESDPAVMRPGMSVRVEVVRGRWETALLVPREAVVYRNGRTAVRRTGSDDLTEVRLAGCTGTACVVESGLEEGERVELR